MFAMENKMMKKLLFRALRWSGMAMWFSAAAILFFWGLNRFQVLLIVGLMAYSHIIAYWEGKNE